MNRRHVAVKTPAGTPTFVPLHAKGPDALSGSVVLAPGTEVPLLAVDLPKTLRGGSREQVAWRQLQDLYGLSADDIEMRPYVGAGKADSWTRVLVVDAALIARWREKTGQACRAILPDYLALPAASDLWVISATEDILQVRLGTQDGFSGDVDMVRLMLGRALSGGDISAPKAVLHLGPKPPWLTDLMGDIPVVDQPDALQKLGVETPKVLAHGELATDLRTDPRAIREHLRRRILPWRWPVLSGMLAVGVWAATQIIDIRDLDQATDTTRAEIETIVRDQFVPTGPILDIRVQVSRALAAQQASITAGSGQVSPLVLLGQVADVAVGLAATPDQITYSQTDGLTMDVRLADFAAVDRLVAALENSGIAAEVRDARVGGDSAGVQVDLRLSPSGGEDK